MLASDCKSVEEQEKLLSFVGMFYEIVEHNKFGYIHARVFRKNGGLCTYGAGRSFVEAIDHAMVSQPLNWHSVKKKMNDKEWLAICHL